MTNSDSVKNRFNIQAKNFSNWSVTKNIEYLQAYFKFCMMTPQDRLLDVACGTGEFSLFSAPKIKHAIGVDISDGMIESAQKQAAENQITNIDFICHAVENIPCESNSFSIVICKSAFHHIHNYDTILAEMMRCCKKNGRISIQDIIAYKSDYINDFFEQLEREIDISHHAALSKDVIINLYKRNNIPISKTFEIEIELNFREYLQHAKQSKENQIKIEELLQSGLNDKEICPYFMVKNDELFFRRNVFLILGNKQY